MGEYHKGGKNGGSRMVVEPVHGESWLAEAALWVSWTHCGSLVANSCAEMVKLDCEVMRRIVHKAGGPLVACLRVCAILFAHKLGDMEENVSDLSMDVDSLDAMACRALKFCSMDKHTEVGSRGQTSTSSDGQFSRMNKGLMSILG